MQIYKFFYLAMFVCLISCQDYSTENTTTFIEFLECIMFEKYCSNYFHLCFGDDKCIMELMSSECLADQEKFFVALQDAELSGLNFTGTPQQVKKLKENIQVLYFDEFSSKNFTSCLWEEMQRFSMNDEINQNYSDLVLCMQPCEDVFITNYQLIGLLNSIFRNCSDQIIECSSDKTCKNYWNSLINEETRECMTNYTSLDFSNITSWDNISYYDETYITQMLFGYYEQNITLECFKNHIFANNSHHIVGKLQSCLKSEINYLEAEQWYTDADYEFIDNWNRNNTLSEEANQGGNFVWAIILVLLILGLIGISIYLWSERRKKKLEQKRQGQAADFRQPNQMAYKKFND